MRRTHLPEILYNLTNQRTTSKCFPFVCHMHQTFSQRSVGMTSEAETTSHLVGARCYGLIPPKKSKYKNIRQRLFVVGL